MNKREIGILWTHSSFKEEESYLKEYISSPDLIKFFWEPLIRVKYLKVIDPKSLNNIQAIFVTSQHALPAFKEGSLKNIPIFTVGDQTAKKAYELGFKHIFSSNGDAQNLKNLLMNNCSPEKGPLFYPRGVNIRWDLKKELEEVNFCTYEEIVYDAIPTSKFLPETIENLKNGEISDVFLFSPRSAEIFMNHMEFLNLKKILKNLRVFCLSPNISCHFMKAEWRKVYVAQEPTLKSLIEIFITNVFSNEEIGKET